MCLRLLCLGCGVFWTFKCESFACSDVFCACSGAFCVNRILVCAGVFEGINHLGTLPDRILALDVVYAHMMAYARTSLAQTLAMKCYTVLC